MVIIHTARVDYRGADALNVSRAGCDAYALAHGGAAAPGAPFAPSWDVVRPMLAVRTTCATLRRAGHARSADVLEAEAWETYRTAYRREMAASFRACRGPWVELLTRPLVTLTCTCNVPPRPGWCHRFYLAAHVFPRIAARIGGSPVALYQGERDSGQMGLFGSVNAAR